MGFGLINPTMDKVLRTFKLDVAYHRADGLHLYDKDGNCYLDFIAQYGAVPFGYNPPEIVRAIKEFLESGIPTMVQPSVPIKAVELAERLIAVTPGNMAHVTFCQSGAEAVETGIKLARSATGRPKIVSAGNSFHGKTMGALSATGREVYQEPFFVPVPGFMTVPFDNLDALEDIFSSDGENIAAFI
ncbi:MAG TPA: aminotransferase class III-fold pyridoxal phosphate-dependent enzyme, partial [Desulfobacteria bacterium]|nr:aminotransferase class III-fold pyridoxal phosphate-dependent enzyme [Desulfobacteria bacterium]